MNKEKKQTTNIRDETITTDPEDIKNKGIQ